MSIIIIHKASLGDYLFQALDNAELSVRQHGNARWQTAFDTAASWLHQTDSYAWDAAHQALTVPSATVEGRSYTANGDCQCKAFAQHNACWHRAAARVLRNALELQAKDEQTRRLAALPAYDEVVAAGFRCAGPGESGTYWKSPSGITYIVVPISKKPTYSAALADLLKCY